jgi:hypothetical protein
VVLQSERRCQKVKQEFLRPISSGTLGSYIYGGVRLPAVVMAARRSGVAFSLTREMPAGRRARGKRRQAFLPPVVLEWKKATTTWPD